MSLSQDANPLLHALLLVLLFSHRRPPADRPSLLSHRFKPSFPIQEYFSLAPRLDSPGYVRHLLLSSWLGVSSLV